MGAFGRFLLVAAVVFAVDRAISFARAEIHVSADVERALAADLEAKLGRAPAPAELAGAVDRWIDDEVLYREAKARHLDEGDPVIRRRLIQSMRVLVETQGVPPSPPPPPELRVDLEHLFFRSAPPADWRARAERGELLGEAFPLGRTLTGKRVAWLRATFGDAFAEAVMSAEPSGASRTSAGVPATRPTAVGSSASTSANASGAWAGPIASPYGWHLVRVTRRKEAPAPAAPSAAPSAALALRARYRVTRR